MESLIQAINTAQLASQREIGNGNPSKIPRSMGLLAMSVLFHRFYEEKLRQLTEQAATSSEACAAPARLDVEEIINRPNVSITPELPPVAMAVDAPIDEPRPGSSSSNDSGQTVLRFTPFDLQRRPARLSSVRMIDQTLEVNLKYKQQMARSFHKARPCTPKEQEKRNRNVCSARVSRAKANVLYSLLQKEHCEEATINRERKITVAKKRAWVKQLMTLLGGEQMNLTAEWAKVQNQIDELVV